MSVMYSVACLLELDGQRGGAIFDDDERVMYGGWIDEWAEWVMNDLPREHIFQQISQLMIGTVCGGFQHSESIYSCSELSSVTFRLENKNQIWDDTLMMTGSFGQRHKLIPVIPLAKIGLFLNRPQYIEEGSNVTPSAGLADDQQSSNS